MFSSLLRVPMLQAAQSQHLRHVIETAPVSRSVVARFVAGAHTEDAVRATTSLVEEGLTVTIDHLGEDTTDRVQAEGVRDAYLELLKRLADSGLTSDGRAEVSLKLSAIGQALGADGPAISTDFATTICEAADGAGTTVTVDMEDHTTTDATLAAVVSLREDFPWVGAVLQSYLRRTEGDCRDLASAGSRVRLCKGAYNEPESVAYAAKADVDKSYVRCMKVLMQGAGFPMLATHDPRMVDIAGALAVQAGREAGSYEYQMLYGIRPDEQKRLAGLGETVRVYLPYGEEWYGYLMRRLAERPQNLSFFAKSLVSKK